VQAKVRAHGAETRRGARTVCDEGDTLLGPTQPSASASPVGRKLDRADEPRPARPPAARSRASSAPPRASGCCSPWSSRCRGSTPAWSTTPPSSRAQCTPTCGSCSETRADRSRSLAPRPEHRGQGRGGARCTTRPTLHVSADSARARRGPVMRIALVGLGWPDDPRRDAPARARATAATTARGADRRQLARSQPRGHGRARRGDLPRRRSDPQRAHLRRRLRRLPERRRQRASSPPSSPPRPLLLERQRLVERLRRTELGRAQPALEDLARDPRVATARPRPTPPLAAVLVDVDPHRLAGGHAPRCAAGATSASTPRHDEEPCSSSGVVQRARLQIGLCHRILTRHRRPSS
jgi:hypothetical protein